MSDKIFFPSDKEEALAMLWLQAQDLSEKTPEELVTLFRDTRNRIHYAFLQK